MKLDDAIFQSLHRYPSIYRSATLAEAKMAVMYHLFTVIGNGWMWTPDGYMMSIFSGADLPRIDVEYEFDTRHFSFSNPHFGGIPGYHATKAPPYGEATHDERHFEARKAASLKPSTMDSWGNGFFLPTTVQEDWLEGVKQTFIAAEESYREQKMPAMAQDIARYYREIVMGRRYSYEIHDFVRPN